VLKNDSSQSFLKEKVAKNSSEMFPLRHGDRKVSEFVSKSGPTLAETQKTQRLLLQAEREKKREIHSLEESKTGDKVVTAGPPLSLFAVGYGEASLLYSWTEKC